MVRQQHGGNLSEARARFGGAPSDWLDLSTGINPSAYPLPRISAAAWQKLPQQDELDELLMAARNGYGIHKGNTVVAAPGTQALIQHLPHLLPDGMAAILGPTYGEYAALFGSRAQTVETFPTLGGQDIAILVNPNNPDGQTHAPGGLLQLAETVGFLIVDEAFCDLRPDLSLCGSALPDNVLVLRSFGKFFGLAGIRLGFAVSGQETAERLSDFLGPWAVPGPALEIGTVALNDRGWIEAERRRLASDMERLHALLSSSGYEIVGGCDLFVTVASPEIDRLFDRLIAERIWSRRFDQHPNWLRLGLPDSNKGWQRLERAARG